MSPCYMQPKLLPCFILLCAADDAVLIYSTSEVFLKYLRDPCTSQNTLEIKNK